MPPKEGVGEQVATEIIDELIEVEVAKKLEATGVVAVPILGERLVTCAGRADMVDNKRAFPAWLIGDILRNFFFLATGREEELKICRVYEFWVEFHII